MYSRVIMRHVARVCCGLSLLLAGPGAAQTMFTKVTAESGYPPFNAEGIAAGDFNNDGWPDLALTEGYADGGRLLLLQNQGQGHFADLSALIQGPLTSQKKGGVLCFADYDNDGDLDLFVPVGQTLPEWHGQDILLRNDRGLFTDVAQEAGLTEVLPSYDATWLDYDRDGHLELYVGHGTAFPADPTMRNRLHHNQGDYLQVDAVGVKSNRTGIGARLIATSGTLKQLREISSATGPHQHEMTAHFGLGTQIQVDTLEIRWPSGLVDVLTGIPVDQKIRVIEGHAGYHHVEPTSWQQAPPETLVAGTIPHLSLAVQPALFDAESRITRVTADLSSLGGSVEVALSEEDDGAYHLRDFPLPAIAVPNGIYTLHVMVDQQTSLGPYWTRLSTNVVVVPAGDLVIFGDEVGTGWLAQPIGGSAKLDLQERETVYQGQGAMRVEAEAFTVDLLPAAPVDPVGYTALRLAFHPGDAVAGFRGAFNVVEEEHTTALPQAFSLSQNFPNPFNSETMIRFALPESEEVELVVYNLAGQQVATLAEGQREAGSYAVHWDGRDGRGKELASGIYLYRLRAGEKMETRKVALIR